MGTGNAIVKSVELQAPHAVAYLEVSSERLGLARKTHRVDRLPPRVRAQGPDAWDSLGGPTPASPPINGTSLPPLPPRYIERDPAPRLDCRCPEFQGSDAVSFPSSRAAGRTPS